MTGIVTGLYFALIIMLLICCCCCYCKRKGKHDTNPTIQEQDNDDETRPLLNGTSTSIVILADYSFIYLFINALQHKC